MSSAAPLSPERIHPALWRGTQLARGTRAAIRTGHPQLTRELPDGGWPTGSLTELLLARPGIGELRLLQPALAALPSTGPIALVQPPCVPHIAAWRGAGLDPGRLWWIDPAREADALWSIEQILKNGSCAALLCWLPRVPAATLRRLHLAAQGCGTLLFALRPARDASLASPAPLRLELRTVSGGLVVNLLKRRGPVCAQPLFIALDTALVPRSLPTHAHSALDRRIPAQAGAGRPASALAT
ncbi:translesion DNA synthesis-associated protein ImuA [Achromobacter aloeverae]|uniref:Cell division protein n=1 Tax=Achromobacter aloeverae TaxID=1750518 RepID=A0A4Q1HPH2_9BURK|nr:translesion DNA synthesis-associated protein ImuA [Achromobacter aloeverae]RXN92727.1 cell division protein [Achromobacter aloeverae]